MLINILYLLRVKDWLKNLLVFIPLIFSNNLLNSHYYFDLVYTFFIFCIASSFIYIMNDIVDIEDDKNHPIKKIIKPLANGKLNILFSKYILFVLILFLGVLIFFDNQLLLFILFYIILNITYIFYFKKIPVIDILVISIGYLIRVEGGSQVINVNTSYLTFCAIFFLSIFVISIKRKKELENNIQSRESLYFYKSNILNIIVYISMIFSFCSYLFYTIFINTNLLLTLPLVILVFLRYLYLTKLTTKGEFPIDVVIYDWKLLILIGIFLFITINSFIYF